MKTRGFTLIELSIVLVIVALLVASIVVGREMIATAQIRNQIKQVEQFKTSVNAFRGKYSCLPGDCRNPGQFGLFSTGMTGAFGLGDGNGLLQDINNNPTVPYFMNEMLVFWRHISDAGLVDGNYGTTLASSGVLPSNQNPDQVGRFIPPLGIKRGSMYLGAYSTGGQNGFQSIAPFNTPAAFSNGGIWFDASMTPLELYAIDSKMDDGMPASGGIRALSLVGQGYFGRPAVLADNCTVTTVTPNIYDTGATYGNQIKCSMGVYF